MEKTDLTLTHSSPSKSPQRMNPRMASQEIEIPTSLEKTSSIHHYQFEVTAPHASNPKP